MHRVLYTGVDLHVHEGVCRKYEEASQMVQTSQEQLLELQQQHSAVEAHLASAQSAAAAADAAADAQPVDIPPV